MTCVKDRIDIKAELKLDDKPHPEEHWEGRFSFKDKSAEHELFMRARIRFAASVVEGQGVLHYAGEKILDADISGEVLPSGVPLTVWVRGADNIHGQLDCTAKLKNDGANLVGTFTHGCINPTECGPECEGGWGDFDLVKIVE